jgi:hypothetical protein
MTKRAAFDIPPKSTDYVYTIISVYSAFYGRNLPKHTDFPGAISGR